MRSKPLSTRRCVLALALLLASCAGDVAVELGYPADFNLRSVSFLDDFDRSDSPPGSLGQASTGLVWQLYGAYSGAYPLPLAHDGFVQGGKYTSTGSSVVYAAAPLRAPLSRVGTVGQWRELVPGSTPQMSIAMAISTNPMLISDVLHLSISRWGWSLTLRSGGGAFTTIAEGEFAAQLRTGTRYWFDMALAPDMGSIRLVLPGVDQTFPFLRGSFTTGPFAFWEEYPLQLPSAGEVFDFDAVWASEAGEPPLPPAETDRFTP